MVGSGPSELPFAAVEVKIQRPVHRDVLVAPRAVADVHVTATQPAHDAALQKRGTFTRRALRPIEGQRLGGLGESALVFRVLLPRDVAGMSIGEQGEPLTRRSYAP